MPHDDSMPDDDGITQRYNLRYRCYVDDTQVYVGITLHVGHKTVRVARFMEALERVFRYIHDHGETGRRNVQCLLLSYP